MTERPILFSVPMVRAILEGRKNQTRRIIKQDGIARAVIGSYYPSIGKTQFNDKDMKQSMPISCPYGQPGDRLWVRESFYGSASKINELIGFVADGDHPHGKPYRVHPSIHMRRKDSRILLEITDVRVERLNEISEIDACAEGFNDRYGFLVGEWARKYTTENPWCWVITFKRLTP